MPSGREGYASATRRPVTVDTGKAPARKPWVASNVRSWNPWAPAFAGTKGHGGGMSIKADKWIRRMALEHRMIDPFSDKQVREGVI